MNFIIFTLTILLAPSSLSNYFCELECSEHHVCCERFPCSLDRKNCGKRAEAQILKENEREFVLELHNEFRNAAAKGIERDADNWGAKNLWVLSYNKELEFVAQCWANACELAQHPCVSMKDYDDVYQNYALIVNDRINSTEQLKLAFKLWMDEIRFLDGKVIDNWQDSDKWANVSALLSSSVRYIGCGRTKYHQGLLLVCFYSPKDKELDPLYLRTYKIKEICSECGTSSCNANYTSLCGDIEKQTWSAPFALGGTRKMSNLTSLFVEVLAILALIFNFDTGF